MTHRKRLVEEPWSYDFYTVMRLVERGATDKARIGESRKRADEPIRIGQDPYMEFPSANIAAASTDVDGRLRLLVRFLGLFGPQGALPTSTTEEAYGWLLARDDAFPRFADIIQGRFLQLFYRAWAEARPIVHADRPEHDRFKRWIGSVAGIAAASVREADDLSTAAKLNHAGLLGPYVRSASRLESFLASLCGARVEVEEFVGAWLTLEPSEHSRLGAKMSSLGSDTFLGASAYSVSDKFRIRVHVADLEAYAAYLPVGRKAGQLADAVFLMMGDELDWDVEIAIPERAVEPTRLGMSGRLGWTSWMIDRAADPGDATRTDARFHLTDRRSQGQPAAA
ncbi:MAG TPA: type VI secretion system baseplate subunit TssG [Methylomirabilota bacterium]|nr:type VI secretion system baseplate subunit TssG [Methylomirabilota bacterium]